jgi:hypothetical protein
VHGPTIIAGNETFPEQVRVKEFLGRVFLEAPTVNTWTTHRTIRSLVILSHTGTIFQAHSKLVKASVNVHPLMPVHLHHIIKFIKKPLQNITSSEMTTVQMKG